MIGGADKLTAYWGHIYPGGYELLVPTIARAVKAGFHVHLIKPGTCEPACTLTDRLAAKPHECWHPLSPQENAAKIRPMVRAAVERAEERYGAPLNVAVDLHPSGYSHAPDPSGFATLDGPLRAWLVPGDGGRGGLQIVPPSVLDGEPVRCWSTCERD